MIRLLVLSFLIVGGCSTYNVSAKSMCLSELNDEQIKLLNSTIKNIDYIHPALMPTDIDSNLIFNKSKSGDEVSCIALSFNINYEKNLSDIKVLNKEYGSGFARSAIRSLKKYKFKEQENITAGIIIISFLKE